ncbi:MAG: hypothetical protein K2X00_07860 [Nitrospiraceae bacterium]|jgi:hypothetical protein|nr:hypothetical protein [Nitrospiraceae bacterium]
MFPEILREGIWHTTSVERFEGILAAGSILPEPSIPDMDRWGAAGGPRHYPFVRSIGAVSVFDFSGFNEAIYEEKYPVSMWRVFVPCFGKWDESIWIELDRVTIKDSFIDGKTLIERWKQQNELERNIMPVIEAAHIGPVPISAFRRIYKCNKHDQEFRQIYIPMTVRR